MKDVARQEPRTTRRGFASVAPRATQNLDHERTVGQREVEGRHQQAHCQGICRRGRALGGAAPDRLRQAIPT
jgi:hypothetical protein